MNDHSRPLLAIGKGSTEPGELTGSTMSRDSRSVCIIVENQPVPFDRRVWQQARALTDAGYRVSVICPKDPICASSHEFIEGIQIYRHSIWSGRGRLGYTVEYAMALVVQFYLALKVYVRSGFTILQACNPPDTVFLIALFFKLFGVRFVFDHHDLCPELFEVKFARRGLLYRIVCLAERLTFRTADLSIATNESYRGVAVARGGMDAQRVVVVQTCADLAEVDASLPAPALKRGKQLMVVYVGVMEIQDGVHLLVESIDYLVKQRRRDDTLFVLIGSGNELPHLQSMTARLGLDGTVEFTGRIPHQQVDSYLSTADICVAPDPSNPLNDNCTMIKNLEYMAHGRPVVLYDLKEGRRTLGDAALYARPNDPIDFALQIEKLLDSPSLRDELGRAGRERAEQDLNWEVQKGKLVAAFAQLSANPAQLTAD